MLTLEKILSLYIPEEFGCDDCNDITDAIGEVIDALDLDFDEFNYGATKFVIYLNNKEVIKIPFNGEWFYQYANDDEIEEGWYFDPFQYHKGNYCDKEMEIYAEAEELGIEQIFTNIEYVGMSTNDVPIYKSERVYKFTYDENERKSSKAAQHSAEMLRNERGNASFCFNLQWLGNAIDFYGENFVRKAMQFIDKIGVTDFHSGNLAYREDGSPVIIDYAGFYH